MKTSSSSLPPLRLGIAGLGTVGAGLMKLLRAEADSLTARAGRGFEVTAVSARDRTRDRGVDLAGIAWEDDAVNLVERPDVDVIVELIGGAEGTARKLVDAALRAGKPVVTANKALLALHGAELAALSSTHEAALLYEAAVAGGIPAINLVRSGLAGDRVTRVGGILNGTSNYILTEMGQTGRDFADVLKEAQDKGYAEADPSTDIGGWDAAHKLAILAGIAFQPVKFESVSVTGIEDITARDLRFANGLGYRIRLLGMAEKASKGEDAGKVVAWVAPCLVPTSSRLAHVNGVFNAVVAEGAYAGPLVMSGAGAGEGPTASAVAGDLVALARGAALPVWGVNPAPAPVDCGTVKDLESAFYLRLLVEDCPGVIASVGKTLAEAGISVHLVSQHELDKKAHTNADAPYTLDTPLAWREETSMGWREVGPMAWMTVITHPVSARHMSKAAVELETLESVMEKPLVLKIESLA